MTADTAVYHCVSRVNGRLRLWEGTERDMFRRMLWRVADFCGVRILTYAVLSNHFHILARIAPAETRVDDVELLRRIARLHRARRVAEVTAILTGPDVVRAETERARWHAQMHDVSAFMKALKQRFSIWFNRTHSRVGTLWEGRFRSVLVEGGADSRALRTVAAYIDLNPVRAGMVDDPARYRWCGYAEAVAGEREAREGLIEVFGEPTWADAARTYRSLLQGSLPATAGSETSALTQRIRPFTEGLVIGSPVYVEAVFRSCPAFFEHRSRKSARYLRFPGRPFADLAAARDFPRANTPGCTVGSRMDAAA